MARLDARGCLGLLLVILGIRALSSPLRSFLHMARLGVDAEMLVITALPVAMATLQIVAGCGFVFRKPTLGWVALAGYVVATTSLLAFATFDSLASDLGALALVVTVVETIGLPVILVVAFAITKAPGSSARREVGVMLIVFAISSLLAAAVRMIQEVRIIIEVAPPGPQLLPQLAWQATYVVVALLELRAGVRLYRGTAKRDLGVWVIAAIANELLWVTVVVIIALFDDRGFGGELNSMWLAIQATTAFVATAFPLFIWGFVRTQPIDADLDPHVPTLPAWNALLFVPFLFARPIAVDMIVVSRSGVSVMGDTTQVLLTAGFVGLAAATAAAAVMALRERMATAAFAAVATALGVVITSGLVVIMQTEAVEPIHTGPFLQILVTTAVIAWLHRTATPSIPRAVAKRVGP